MDRFIQYVTELKLHIIHIVEREMESLVVLDVDKFRELQNIEGQLLVLLNDACSVIRQDLAILHRGDHDAIARLSSVCIEFDKCLAAKHDAIGLLQRCMQGYI
ncbi:MAG: hypothetical protein AB8U44_01275 [Aaplasma endosymbiont of Hyalomma asiaticum]